MTGHGKHQEQKNKKQESDQTVLTITKALTKTIIYIIVPVQPKNLNNFLYENKSWTLVAVGWKTKQAGGKSSLSIHKCVDLYLHRFPVGICSPNCIMFSDGLRLGPLAHFVIVPHFIGDIA